MSLDAPELDVALYVHKYIDKTLSFRYRAVRKGLGKPNQLFFLMLLVFLLLNLQFLDGLRMS